MKMCHIRRPRVHICAVLVQAHQEPRHLVVNLLQLLSKSDKKALSPGRRMQGHLVNRTCRALASHDAIDKLLRSRTSVPNTAGQVEIRA